MNIITRIATVGAVASLIGLSACVLDPGRRDARYDQRDGGRSETTRHDGRDHDGRPCDSNRRDGDDRHDNDCRSPGDGH